MVAQDPEGTAADLVALSRDRILVQPADAAGGAFHQRTELRIMAMFPAIRLYSKSLTGIGGFPAVSNAHNQNHQVAALPLIDHAITANAQTPQPLELSLESRARCRRVTQQIDRLNQAFAIKLWQAGQGLGRGLLNPQRAALFASREAFG